MDNITDRKTSKLWDFLLNYGIATQAELELATGLTGYNEETLNDVLYIFAQGTGVQNSIYMILVK